MAEWIDLISGLALYTHFPPKNNRITRLFLHLICWVVDCFGQLCGRIRFRQSIIFIPINDSLGDVQVFMSFVIAFHPLTTSEWFIVAHKVPMTRLLPYMQTTREPRAAIFLVLPRVGQPNNICEINWSFRSYSSGSYSAVVPCSGSD